MNRIKSSSRGALADYSLRLEREGLVPDVVAVQEHHIPRGAQSIPTAAVEELRDRLVAVIDARRAGSTDVVRSVLETTLDQARDVIDEAADLLEVGGEATLDVRRLLEVDLDRIGARRRPGPGPGLDLGPLVEIGSKRFRTRRMIRRRSPAPADVSTALELFDESIIAAVDADMRRQFHAGNLIHGQERKNLLADIHVAARSAVTAWRADIDGSAAVTGSMDPALVSLLLGRFCLEGPHRRLGEVIRLLAPTIDLVAAVTEAREALIGHLVPIYADAEYRLASRIAGLTASRRSIDRVKASRWAVIARSSFANA
jgi:hypothetical protein